MKGLGIGRRSFVPECRNVFPLVFDLRALCKLCWAEILSAGLWVGFSY